MCYLFTRYKTILATSNLIEREVITKDRVKKVWIIDWNKNNSPSNFCNPLKILTVSHSSQQKQSPLAARKRVGYEQWCLSSVQCIFSSHSCSLWGQCGWGNHNTGIIMPACLLTTSFPSANTGKKRERKKERKQKGKKRLGTFTSFLCFWGGLSVHMPSLGQQIKYVWHCYLKPPWKEQPIVTTIHCSGTPKRISSESLKSGKES